MALNFGPEGFYRKIKTELHANGFPTQDNKPGTARILTDRREQIATQSDASKATGLRLTTFSSGKLSTTPEADAFRASPIGRTETMLAGLQARRR